MGGPWGGVDWSKVHLFFVNERTPEGKCFKLATDTWVSAVGMPDSNVHKVGTGTPAEEAKLYEAGLVHRSSIGPVISTSSVHHR